MDLNKTDYQYYIISKIKNLRIQNGINQSELGRILGISSGQVGNIESVKYPHKYTLRQISLFCEHIGYPVEEVFTDADEAASLSTSDVIKNIVKYEQ